MTILMPPDTTPVTCAGCPAVGLIWSSQPVRSRLSLRAQGWRRDPIARRHYCGGCAPTVADATAAPR